MSATALPICLWCLSNFDDRIYSHRWSANNNKKAYFGCIFGYSFCSFLLLFAVRISTSPLITARSQTPFVCLPGYLTQEKTGGTKIGAMGYLLTLVGLAAFADTSLAFLPQPLSYRASSTRVVAPSSNTLRMTVRIYAIAWGIAGVQVYSQVPCSRGTSNWACGPPSLKTLDSNATL